MACIVCRSAVPAGASGCQKCTLPCCSRCMNDHQIRCEGWCEGKCKTCQALRPLVKCVRCSTWICTGCMDNEFGGPCCLYCALACRRAGVSIHQSPSIAGSRPLTASQPQPQAASQPVNLFDMGSTQPPPAPTAPPPPVAQPRPAAPSQPVVQPRPTAYQQPYQQQQQQQQAPPQPYQQQQPYGTPFAQPAYQQQQQQPYQQQPAAYGYPAVNPAYVPPQAPLVQPTVKTPVQPGPQAAVKQPPPVPAAAPPVQPQRPQAALPGPVLTVMSTLPEKAARVLDQVHMTIGDFGDLFFADGTEGQGRLVGVSGDYGVFEMDTGERRHILLTNIFSFAKDESKSSPITPVATNARKIIKMDFVGGGAQGQVYTARYEDEREARIVVKEINFKPNEVAQADLQEQKARELMSMRHEHLIQYLDVRRISPSQLWIVMPYYKENDMVNFLENLRQPLSEYALSSLVLQIASALHFLHTRSPPRLHRDVKLDNILMFDQGTRTMLVDMDFSRTMPENNRAAMSRVGTYEYMAPEVERGRSSPASDMWSLGVILYVLLIMPDTLLMKHPNGTTMPFNSPEWTQEVLERTLRKEAQDSVRRRRINPPYSIELVNLMCALLQKDERCRPTAAQTKEALENVMLQCLVRGDAPTR